MLSPILHPDAKRKGSIDVGYYRKLVYDISLLRK